MDLIALDPFAAPAAVEEIRRLIAASFDARYDDLAAALGNARRAVALLEESPVPLPADLVIDAWTQYGNALRLTGLFAEAEEALAKADARVTFVLPSIVRFLGVKASLSCNTGGFAAAATCLAIAIDLQRSLGDPAGEARLHNLLGIVYKDWGKLPLALRSFENAMALLGPDTPADVVVSTGHNVFGTLIAAERLQEAAAALALLEPYYRHLTSPRILAKAEWMRARLCRAMHQLPAARLAYERAYEILNVQPCSPELAELATEIAGLGEAHPSSARP